LLAIILEFSAASRRETCLNSALYTSSLAIALVAATATSKARSAAPTVLSGADVSSLPDIERAGGKFSDQGHPGDEIKILADHGCQLFRVRLFVDPAPSFAATDGATQNLGYVRALGKRIKAAGGQFLLDIHYSDTWADPGKQATPRAWSALDFDAMKQKVTDYTTSVIKDLQSNGAAPDMVQVGNEITSGMLWPQGKLNYDGAPELQRLQWEHFTALVAAGVRGVRAAEQDRKKITVIVHVHGGGQAGLPQWFFNKFMANGGNAVDFDIIGLSFYPAWKDSLGNLKRNMADLIASYGKDVLLVETSYPWQTLTDIQGRESMEWPQTPQGQLTFLRDLRTALSDAPNHHGMGFVWWYSDAIPVPGYRIWRSGNEALFDHEGNALPALSMFAAQP
jgi:arabinogalactan endo-1,4-beta-galactosidase